MSKPENEARSRAPPHLPDAGHGQMHPLHSSQDNGSWQTKPAKALPSDAAERVRGQGEGAGGNVGTSNALGIATNAALISTRALPNGAPRAGNPDAWRAGLDASMGAPLPNPPVGLQRDGEKQEDDQIPQAAGSVLPTPSRAGPSAPTTPRVVVPNGFASDTAVKIAKPNSADGDGEDVQPSLRLWLTDFEGGRGPVGQRGPEVGEHGQGGASGSGGKGSGCEDSDGADSGGADSGDAKGADLQAEASRKTFLWNKVLTMTDGSTTTPLECLERVKPGFEGKEKREELLLRVQEEIRKCRDGENRAKRLTLKVLNRKLSGMKRKADLEDPTGACANNRRPRPRGQGHGAHRDLEAAAAVMQGAGRANARTGGLPMLTEAAAEVEAVQAAAQQEPARPLVQPPAGAVAAAPGSDENGGGSPGNRVPGGAPGLDERMYTGGNLLRIAPVLASMSTDFHVTIRTDLELDRAQGEEAQAAQLLRDKRAAAAAAAESEHHAQKRFELEFDVYLRQLNSQRLQAGEKRTLEGAQLLCSGPHPAMLEAREGLQRAVNVARKAEDEAQAAAREHEQRRAVVQSMSARLRAVVGFGDAQVAALTESGMADPRLKLAALIAWAVGYLERLPAGERLKAVEAVTSGAGLQAEDLKLLKTHFRRVYPNRQVDEHAAALREAVVVCWWMLMDADAEGGSGMEA